MIMEQEKCCTPIGQVKRHADCNTCHLKPKKLDLSKYTIGFDPYDKKQSALEWLVTELFAYRQPNSIEIQLVKHAKEMEKQQIIDVYDNAYIDRYYYNSRNGKQYYNEQFKSQMYVDATPNDIDRGPR